LVLGGDFLEPVIGVVPFFFVFVGVAVERADFFRQGWGDVSVGAVKDAAFQVFLLFGGGRAAVGREVVAEVLQLFFGERKPGGWGVDELAGGQAEFNVLGGEVLGPVGADGGGIGVEDGVSYPEIGFSRAYGTRGSFGGCVPGTSCRAIGIRRSVAGFGGGRVGSGGSGGLSIRDQVIG